MQRATHAIAHYGSGAGRVLAFCPERADTPLPGTCYTEAELRYLVLKEQALTLADLLQRRTSLAITGEFTSATIARAAEIPANELGWPDRKAAEEEHAFRARLAHDHGLTEAILTERDRNTTRSLECA